MQDVDYIETVVRRERRGSSHGLRIRTSGGPYYRPSSFQSRVIEREEAGHLRGLDHPGILGPPPSITTTDCQIWCQPLCIRLGRSYRSTLTTVSCQVQIGRKNQPVR